MAALVALLAVGFGYSLPADLALLAAIDMTTYVDALLGVYVVANVARLKPMIAYLRVFATRAARRARKRTSRAFRKAMRKSAEHDGHPVRAVAA